jgi:UDP-N-acetylglucosamine--N-acetylmuramyl-(pentapeptide) pyrophosphoryl-undecaprenol N-acetylglucosamine transferase
VSTLLVAATGGHLSQLVRLEPRLGLTGEPTWVTFDTAQSRELLAGRDVVHARYTRPRDYAAVARNLPLALRLLRRHDRVISTGSGIALSFLPQAALMRREAHYIESAARATGPSVTGRALARMPGVRLYTQYPGWAGGRWRYAGSVFDAYAQAQGPAPPAGRPLRVALSVGTLFPFPRLVERLRAVLPPDAEVLLWQAGEDSTVPPAELRAAFRAADAVVVHSGVGAALEALDAGRRPLLVPRRKQHGEHVDDHQLQVAGELEGRGLAVVRDASELRAEDLLAAAAGRVEAVAEPPPLDLGSRP